MKTQKLLASALLALATLSSIHAPAATFCVDSADALATALASAEANGEDNDIRIRAGVYDAPDAGFHIDLLRGITACPLPAASRTKPATSARMPQRRRSSTAMTACGR